MNTSPFAISTNYIYSRFNKASLEGNRVSLSLTHKSVAVDRKNTVEKLLKDFISKAADMMRLHQNL
jgi:hypothetical protein